MSRIQKLTDFIRDLVVFTGDVKIARSIARKQVTLITVYNNVGVGKIRSSLEEVNRGNRKKGRCQNWEVRQIRSRRSSGTEIQRTVY